MVQIIHPGWLLLLICTILLLLVGCSILPSRTPVPSATAPLNITLTVLPLPESPLPRSTRPAATMTPLYPVGLPTWQRTASPPPEQDLYVETPVCSSTYNGYSCLGRVWNYGKTRVHDVTLRVLLRDDGEVLERYYSLEQRLIPPGGFAPYRILFTSGQFERIDGAAALSYASQALVPITIVDERGLYNASGRYVITTSIRNDTDRQINTIRTVATVVDEWDRVVGYRIQERQQILNVGENIMIRLEIIPQVGGIDHHYLHAEGQQTN